MIHWNPKVITMPTLTSLAAPEVVMMTTANAVGDDKVGIVITFGFQWNTNACFLEYLSRYKIYFFAEYESKGYNKPALLR